MVRYLFYTIGDLTYQSPLICVCILYLTVSNGTTEAVVSERIILGCCACVD